MVRGADVDFRDDRASRGASASASTSRASSSVVVDDEARHPRRHHHHPRNQHRDELDAFLDAAADDDPFIADGPARPDLYAALGVSPSATTDEITAAYRAVALRCHPDRNKGDAAAETFKAAAEARRVLSDPRMRAFYDAGGSMEEMDVDVEEYVDAFRALFEERFGGADVSSLCAGATREELRRMPPFPFPKFLFPPGTFPDGLRFDASTFTPPPRVRAFLDDHGEDALSELAGELAARAESRRGDEDEDEDDEEEDIETDAELRAFIMEALAGELDDEDLFEGVDVDAGVERLVESMKEFDFGKAMNGLADLHESSSAEDEDLGSSSFGSPSFSVGRLARFSDSDELPTSATILARWFAAAKSGDADILRDMLREDPSLLHARSSGLGHTAAHWAAAKGHADVVAWLVDARGYEVDFPNACGATALHAAAANGWEECVSVLLSLGASVDAEDEIGETPCDAAVRMQRGEALVVALGGDPGRAAIFCAPCEPSFESTTAAVLPVVEEEPERDDEGDDENAPIPDDDRRVVVLEREIQRRWLDAAKTGDLDAMRALFAENEDVLFSQGVGTSYGFSGNTALHWAAAKGHAACVRWLYASGIDPNVKNNGDGTAAHSAAGAGALDSLRILAHECGAKMDLLNSVDETPLDVAAHANHGDVVEFLRTAPALERLREEFSRDDACSTKLAKIVVHARASSDLSCRGLTEKSEIVQKAREIVDALPARISRERERERPLFRSAAEATRDDDRVDDTVVALAKKRGNTHFAAGDYEAAIKSYSMAIRLDRANAVLFSNRSAARLGAGAVEDALADAKTAVRLAPEVGKYYARQAAALNDMGQHAEALEVCRRGLARDASCHALTVVADESERRLREGRARYDAMWGDRDREKT